MNDDRPRYKGICPKCGAVLWICPSIAMKMGWDDEGHGICHQCGSFLHLKFEPDRKVFSVQPWSRYIKALMDDKKD